MAKLSTKVNDNSNLEEKKVDTKVEEEVKVETTSSSTLDTKEEVKEKSEPEYDLNSLLNLINSMKKELDDLKKGDSEKQESKSDKVDNVTNTESKTEKLLEILASKKSDKEITIVHNRELGGGLSTHISLTGTTIDFHTLGEERTLSWQQFEECVSKYKRWFDKQIILLGEEHEDLCSKYNIPCVKRKDGKTLTRKDLVDIGTYSVKELEEFYKSLTKEDQAFICSFWLGKCYEKDPVFYDRYKIECLNRLSNNNVFDNILTVMNNEFSRGN